VKLFGPNESLGVVPSESNVVEIVDFKKDVVWEKKKHKSYEVFQKCQDAWATQHPWSEMIQGTRDSTIHRVKCVICSAVKGCTMIVGPKSITLEKHAGKTLAIKDFPELGVKKDEYYISKSCQHLVATKIYNAMWLNGPTILNQVQRGFKGDHVRKVAQFANVFHLLYQGQPMLEYESHKELFNFFEDAEKEPKALERHLRLAHF
jgi:hypothetical protein